MKSSVCMQEGQDASGIPDASLSVCILITVSRFVNRRLMQEERKNEKSTAENLGHSTRL